MIIIGLVGKKQSGKNTVADIIKRSTDKIAVEASFAFYLKQEVAKALGITVAEIEADKERFRGILQWWGTEWRRKQDENYWVNKLLDDLDELDFATIVIVTDVRFQNEATSLIRYGNDGAVMVRIYRNRLANTDTHASETELETIGCDMCIYNDGTLEDLEKTVKEKLVPLLK